MPCSGLIYDILCDDSTSIDTADKARAVRGCQDIEKTIRLGLLGAVRTLRKHIHVELFATQKSHSIFIDI